MEIDFLSLLLLETYYWNPLKSNYNIYVFAIADLLDIG